jgi:hypothetical protein
MNIQFTTWEEWNDTLAKMNAGLVVCPDCNQWVEALQWIPEEYKNLAHRSFINWCKVRTDYESEDERREAIEYLENDKETTKYCCKNCFTKRVKHKTEIDLEEKYDYCDICGEWVEKGTTTCHRKHRKGASKHFCVKCLAIDDAEYEFLKATEKERDRIYFHNKRTAALGLVSDLTIEEWLGILDYYGNRCAECEGDWTDLDHIIPVSKGGGTTKNNVRPLCKHCNSVKNDKELQVTFPDPLA